MTEYIFILPKKSAVFQCLISDMMVIWSGFLEENYNYTLFTVLNLLIYLSFYLLACKQSAFRDGNVDQSFSQLFCPINLVQTKTSHQLLDGFRLNFEQLFKVPRGWILMTSVILWLFLELPFNISSSTTIKILIFPVILFIN